MPWCPCESGRTIGASGCENGVILRDEEHAEGARITLESGCDHGIPFAITCGIHGWMCHTRFLGDEGEANESCEAMKTALAEILREIPFRVDPEADERSRIVCEMIARFVERFP